MWNGCSSRETFLMTHSSVVPSFATKFTCLASNCLPLMKNWLVFGFSLNTRCRVRSTCSVANGEGGPMDVGHATGGTGDPWTTKLASLRAGYTSPSGPVLYLIVRSG